MDSKENNNKHSFFGNIGFMFGNMWRWSPGMLALSLLRAPFMVVVPLIGLLLSRTVISLIEAGADLNRIVATIALLCLATAACMVMLNYLNAQNRRMEYLNSNKYQHKIFEAMMLHDYEYNESPAGLTAVMKALENCGGGGSGARAAINTISSCIGNVMGIVSYAAIMLALNPVILLTICVTSVLSYFSLRLVTSWVHKNKDNWLSLDRRRDHVEVASKDLAPAKDIRLYNMAGWLRELFTVVLQDRMAWHKKEQSYALGIDMLCALLSLLREGVAYGLLVYMMFDKSLPVADFVLYFGVVGGFTVWVDGLTENFSSFNRMHVGFGEMRQYLDYENQSNRGSGKVVPKETFSIEFQNVGHRFSGSEEFFFKDFNLTIRKGEKLAIVGLNGAGKTTLVKLLSGLYRPTEGVILADGQPIDAYNIDEYQSLFSAVFQDITILPMTVRQNITCQLDGVDEDRLDEALRLSGFDAVVQKMCKGADTYLIRGLYPEAVDLSGGETQKLALARMLYRGGKFLILDEPTAALDSIAESHIYQQYNDISSGKTSVFISHRLASTRFCDRILFLEDGRIIEDGSHDQLMALQGKYYELFEVQSHYYKDEVQAV